VSQNLTEIREMGDQAWAEMQFKHAIAAKHQRLLDAVNKAFEQERKD
jgi:hypothetical protein